MESVKKANDMSLESENQQLRIRIDRLESVLNTAMSILREFHSQSNDDMHWDDLLITQDAHYALHGHEETE